MVNEMGNTNSSADQVAEKAAVETQQKGETAVNEDYVKEENNIITEFERKNYHEKAAALSTYDPSTAKEPNLENSEDDKKDEDMRETQVNHTAQCSEVQTGTNDSVSEVANIGTHSLDQHMNSNLERKDELHDQPSNQKGETEGSIPQDEVLMSDQVESSNLATEAVEENFISSSHEEQETTEKGRTGQNEDKIHLINSEISIADKIDFSDTDEQNVIIQRDDSLEGEVDASANRLNEEKYEVMSAENQVDNLSLIGGYLDGTPKIESSQSHATGSLLTDNPQITPSSSFGAVLEPEDKCVVHTPETELVSNGAESAVKKCDLKKTDSSEQEVNEMQINTAAPSIESQPKESAKEKLPGNNTNIDMVMDYSMEEAIVMGNINVQPDILHYFRALQAVQYINSEENFEMLPEIGLLPTKPVGMATNIEEESSTENGHLEKAKEGVEKSNRKETMETCILQLESSKPVNDVYINHTDGRMQGFESVEDQKSCELVVTEVSGVFELKKEEKEEVKVAGFSETGNGQNVQPSLEALAFSNEKCVFEQKVSNFNDEIPSKAPESIGRLSLESTPEKSSYGIELRKSPSFDFGVHFHRRSLESDRTPLLIPEKTPTRSSSVGTNARVSIISTEYGRSSLDYDAIAVEEKTIRVERSDSDISKTPLLGLSKYGENGNQKVTPETQQNHAVMKEDDLQISQENETSLTSPKGSVKRKPRPSFFSTCICCTAAATH